jgi:adenosylmethionine-8-amino-7-oxononanoate aminotransferase
MSPPSNAELRALDLAHVWHPCTQMKDHEAELPLVPMRRGRGVWLEDHDGKHYIDAISSWWVNLWGHAHPTINAAVAAQLERLPHVMFAGCTHEAAAELARRLTALAPPGLERCFFADSGSAAIEIAVKMSFHYWQNVGQLRKTRFVTLTNSYHGETLGALAVGNVELYKSVYRPLLMDVITVGSPDAYRAGSKARAEQIAREKAAELDAVLAAQGEEIAAVILEPLVQCAGAMRMYDPVYLQEVRASCDRHGVHLIADEIAVGFGRTGTLFACEQAAITPDFLCLSKGLTAGYLPMSVVLTRDSVYQAFYDEYAKLNAFLHSHSYSGNPLACAAAIASLDLFASTDALQRNRQLASELGVLVQNQFAAHEHVAEIRQCGMIVAVEFVKDKHTGEPFPWRERRHLAIHRYALEHGVLLRPLGNVIYFMPPYVITAEEMATMVSVARRGLDHAVGSACAAGR